MRWLTGMRGRAVRGIKEIASVLILASTVTPSGASAEPVASGFTVELYAPISNPNRLTFAPNGDLYVGNSLPTGTPQKIRRVSSGGATVQEFGPNFGDPDSVLFDSSGLIAPVPGSVLVGSNLSSSLGTITAIAPDETSTVVIGPSSASLNPQSLDFDGLGRLVFMNQTNSSGATLSVTTGGTPAVAVLAATASGGYVEYDAPTNLLFVLSGGSGDSRSVQRYDLDGSLVGAPLIESIRNGLAIGQGGAFGRAVYVYRQSGGELLAVSLDGGYYVLGSGFSTVADLEFGPDGALYASMRDDDEILRIAPVPCTDGETLAYWRFDDDPGAASGGAASSVADELHNGGAAIGSPVPTYSDAPNTVVPQTGTTNNLSLEFERDFTQHVAIPHSPGLSLGASAFTIEAWIKLESLGESCPVCEEGTCSIVGGVCAIDDDCGTDPVCDPDGAQGNSAYLVQKKGTGNQHDREMEYGFVAQFGDRGNGRAANPSQLHCKSQDSYSGRELAFEFGDGTTFNVVVAPTLEINDTDWHFVSMAFDGSDSVRFGVDGHFETCSGLAGLGHTRNFGELLIGAKATVAAMPPSSIKRRFDGKLDELRISCGVIPEGALLDASVNDVPAMAPLNRLLLVGLLALAAVSSFALHRTRREA